ncbi:hypothetical protein ACTNDG_02010 [Clostridium sp. HCP1S3_B4]|uniref:hypothetical protein n=1 Tax=unclassified Clostridium TaxID=2614128 RepID=UPI0016AEEA97|nr:hypothetical protein [Clostridiales bacterium]NLK23718.1 hypothetical protein [Clostridiales bacterium]
MSEILTFIVGICLLVVVFKFIKGIVKFLISAVIVLAVIGGFFYFSNGGSIDKLKEGTEQYTEIVKLVNENKDKVKLENGNVMFNINNKWYDTSELNKVKKTENGYSTEINGQKIEVTDEEINEAIRILLN